MSTSPLHITLVDDSELAAAGLTSLLQPFGDRVVVMNHREAIAHPADLDVVLYEPLGLSGMGESLLRDLTTTGEAKPAVFSWAPVDDLPASTTNPHLSKSLTGAQLVVTLEKLAAGRLEAPPAAKPAAAPVVEASRPAAPAPSPGEEAGLTPRETEIVGLIVAGLSNREIGEALTLSINSVKTYIRSAYRKMGVERRTQAVLWGLARGMDSEAPAAMVS